MVDDLKQSKEALVKSEKQVKNLKWDREDLVHKALNLASSLKTAQAELLKSPQPKIAKSNVTSPKLEVK